MHRQDQRLPLRGRAEAVHRAAVKNTEQQEALPPGVDASFPERDLGSGFTASAFDGDARARHRFSNVTFVDAFTRVEM
ncbi:hypothetical protein MRX96_055884 [Rhipicephalus microplus]